MPFEFAKCDRPEIFIHKELLLPSFLKNTIGLSSLYYSDFSIHAIVLSVFASLIAPFGGFFASG